MPSRDSTRHDAAPVLDPVAARQGERRGIVWRILVPSTALVVTAFVICYFIFFD